MIKISNINTSDAKTSDIRIIYHNHNIERMNFTVVALAVIVIILVYILYQYFTTNQITLAKQVAFTMLYAADVVDKQMVLPPHLM